MKLLKDIVIEKRKFLRGDIIFYMPSNSFGVVEEIDWSCIYIRWENDSKSRRSYSKRRMKDLDKASLDLLENSYLIANDEEKLFIRLKYGEQIR